MKVARIVLLALVATTFLGAFIACSSDDNKTLPSPTKSAVASSATTKASSSPLTSATSSPALEVTAKEFSFTPADLDATKGTSATFKLTNGGTVSHTMTVYTDDKYTDKVQGADTGIIAAGKSGQFTVTFDKTGDFYFRCEIHPTQMKGEIAVQ